MMNWREKYLRLPLWGWTLIAGILLAILITGALVMPSYGSWRIGACRALLETVVRFPSSIDYLEMGESATSAGIVYTDINAYGTQQIKTFECYYSADAQGNIVLSRVMQNRRALSEATLKSLNEKLPIILTQELDTQLPKPLPSKLENFRR